MRHYRIGDAEFPEETPALQKALAEAFSQKVRPLCLCRPAGVAMYIARFENHYLVKRMPSSGTRHDPSCSSYEPPYELSGLGPLIGDAIRIDDARGTAALRLDFALSKTGSRTAGAHGTSEAPSVKGESKRLSLRGLLHYLWQEGELTEWTALWAGKRGWGRVRSSLLDAARHMKVSGGALSDILFVPEVFQSEAKAAISARRTAALASLVPTAAGRRKLMVLVGEVKETQDARIGRKLLVKHMPDYPLMIDDSVWRRLQKRYAAELALWEADPSLHLIAITTFGLNAAGLPAIEEIALMIATENWIPFETIHEQKLLERLARLKRKSVKGLRFNLGADQPIVCATLPDAKPAAAALYVVPPEADERYEAALADMITARPEMTAWIWRPGDGEMPSLP
ncbi:hypothetical protein BJF93_07140 [Xaviernesmea oryzae]|uniref:DUF1173 domain-containing protein n=1 Tax=Xaviernesmea oryzae TaxID=464029 RepID=A0A1Q9B3N3_9HYPH|nr:DUF1173 domain-containing protein [Xaviernesmea oryzae]OLP62656.1 hypothetical protein BJF93_07140 [Xaviernesmea oryzae]SEM27527.1 Protein of unknown function [Xaviernesmea oryzae]